MLALCQSSGIDCWHNDAWNIRARGGAISDDVSLSNLTLMLSGPLDLLGFNWFNSLIILSVLISVLLIELLANCVWISGMSPFSVELVDTIFGWHDQFWWSSYAVSLSLSPCPWFSRSLFVLAHYQISGRDWYHVTVIMIWTNILSNH